MKSLLRTLPLVCLYLSSCATDNAALQERLDKRNASYQQLQDRRQMREQARDERYDAWFDRVMN